jgi:hypothetical protein
MDWGSYEGSGVDASIQGTALAYGWMLIAWAIVVTLLLGAALLLVAPSVRRRFWCSTASQSVEVEFDECGLPGRRRPISVLACSAFTPSTAVTCARNCLAQRAERSILS